MSVLKTLFHQDSGCLNPYSIGRYSMSYTYEVHYQIDCYHVLILILLEDTL